MRFTPLVAAAISEFRIARSTRPVFDRLRFQTASTASEEHPEREEVEGIRAGERDAEEARAPDASTTRCRPRTSPTFPARAGSGRRTTRPRSSGSRGRGPTAEAPGSRRARRPRSSRRRRAASAGQKLQPWPPTSEPTVNAPIAANEYWQNETWPTSPVSTTSDSTISPTISEYAASDW